MNIPILSGIYTDSNSNVRVAYPVNLVPVPGQSGLSDGYLRPSYGAITLGTGPGVDRGAANWDGVCYRVMGTNLVSVAEDGTVTTIDTVSGTDLARLNYSFDYLSVNADNKLWLYDGATLTQIVDPDLGDCVDHIFVDGYFMSTDGEYVVVTELANPFSVSSDKYASSEFDPDPVLALLKPRNEPHALNRYSIEIFYNVGGTGFPFAKNLNAVITKGTVGTRTCCVMSDVIAFMGSGRGEAISVYIGAAGQTNKIAPREIDLILAEYTETELSLALLETKNDVTEQLYIHLPDLTLVYDKDLSNVFGVPIWFILTNSLFEETLVTRRFEEVKKYNARNMVRCYDKWIVGDPNTSNIGYLTDTLQSMYGEDVRWELNTQMFYNSGLGAIVNQIELVGLPGRQVQGKNPTIYTRYSNDGELYSQRKKISLGQRGNTTKRMVWFNQGLIRNYRIQQFSGISDAMASFMRLEVQLEGLNA